MSKNDSIKKSGESPYFGSREGPSDHSISMPTNTTMGSGKSRPSPKND